MRENKNRYIGAHFWSFLGGPGLALAFKLLEKSVILTPIYEKSPPHSPPLSGDRPKKLSLARRLYKPMKIIQVIVNAPSMREPLLFNYMCTKNVLEAIEDDDAPLGIVHV